MEYEIDTELEPNSDNPSENSMIETATDNQSSVRPEQYPKQERDAQKAVLIPEEEDQD